MDEKERKGFVVLEALEAPQLCRAGNPGLLVVVVVKDEAAQGAGEREKDRNEKNERNGA